MRTQDRELPKNISRKGGSYYFVTSTKPRKWLPLGSDLSLALARSHDVALRHGIETAQTLLPSEYRVEDLMRLVRKSARARSLDSTLTPGDLARLIRRANGRCEVSGMAFSTERPPGQRIRLYAPSVDRIDASRGYSLENCRIVCAAVNIALNAFGDEIFARLLHNCRSSTKSRAASSVTT